MTQRKYGWKQDYQESWLHYKTYTDHRLLQRTPPGDTNLSGLAYVTNVLDQGQLGSCVANALSGSIHASMARAGHPNPPWISRLQLYWAARAISGDENTDGGTYPLNAFQALHDLGFCEETYWPYDENKVNERPPFDAYRMGYDQKVLIDYPRIDDSGQNKILGVKSAVDAGHFATFGTEVDLGFERYTGGVWSFGGPAIGGHALTIVGYVPAGPVVLNSWGQTWGEHPHNIDPNYRGPLVGGFVVVSWQTFLDKFQDIVVPTVVPYFSEAA